MPPFATAPCDDEHCEGIHHSVADDRALAHVVALVLVQEFTVARSILGASSTSRRPRALRAAEVAHIIRKRIRVADVYNRDGFLFQLIAWIAAHGDASASDHITQPHVRHADKGQDGVILHFGAEPHLASVTICEDKATENPRDTIREEVWRDLRDYEVGARDDELRSRVIAGLGSKGVAEEEAVDLVEAICWNSVRRYRVRVTVAEPRNRNLFKGYPDVVVGGVVRRRGETFLLPGLRAWMATFADAVEHALLALVKEP